MPVPLFFCQAPLIHQYCILLLCLRHYSIIWEIASSSETVHGVTRYVSCEHWLLYNALFWDVHGTVQLVSSLGFRSKGVCLGLGWGINYYLFFFCGLHSKDLREPSSDQSTDLGVKHDHFLRNKAGCWPFVPNVKQASTPVRATYFLLAFLPAWWPRA